MLLTDRVIVKTSIKIFSIKLNYGYKLLLPVKIEVLTRNYLK
jgi:hypothetical protein